MCSFVGSSLRFFHRCVSLRWLTLGVMLIVTGSHFWLIKNYASDQPFSDQWGAEGHILFEQWVHDRLPASYFFFSHAEHRPALTRLLAFAEFVLNGQWDCRVQMVVNVAICALSAGVMCEFARRFLSPRIHFGVALLAAVLFSLPSNYENVLWGFQSQFYFLLLLGPLHILGSCRSNRVDMSWWLAQLAGLLALFSIAAGVMSAVTLVGLTVFALIRGRRSIWSWATLVINLGLVFYACWLRPDGSALASLHANSAGQFLISFGRMLAWPSHSWAGLLLALPLVVFCFRSLLQRDLDADTPCHGLVALGLWSWLVIATLAYGRGAISGMIAIRYFDVLALSLFVNALALSCLALSFPRRYRLFALLAVGWVGLLITGVWRLNAPDYLGPGLAVRRDFFSRQQSVVSEFLATNDEASLQRDSAVRVFFPHYEFTKGVLRDPLLRRRLPPSIVPPLALVRDASRSNGFVVQSEVDGAISSAESVSAHDQQYISEPIERAGLALLRFRVRGQLVEGKSELLLEDANGRRVRPLGNSGDDSQTWRTVNFVAPAGPLRIVARTTTGSMGFAFTFPIEVGPLSWLAPKVVGCWAWVASAGAGCLVIGASAVRRVTREGHRD